MVALPLHEPCGLAGYGNLTGKDMDIRCEVKRSFKAIGVGDNKVFECIDSKGCGKVSSTCDRCGVRAVWDGAPCEACLGKIKAAKL
jgi:hypothetical protein